MARFRPLVHQSRLLAALLLLLALPRAGLAGFWPANLGISVTRSFTPVDSPLPLYDTYTATWTLRVLGQFALTGLYCSEQLPAWLNVSAIQATRNGQPIPCAHEQGEAGDPLANLVAHRFIFDEPGNADPDLILNVGDVLVLHYVLSSGQPGVVETRYNGWCALLAGDPGGPVGGWLDEAPVLLFLRDESPLMLEDIQVVTAVDHLQVIWSLSLEGESQSFRLQRGSNADPWQSAPLGGDVLQGPGDYRYSDFEVEAGRSYWYWIAILDATDQPLCFLGPGVGSLADSPLAGRLLQSFPNPFNPQTTLCFSLDQAGPVVLSVFDLQGRLLRCLASGDWPAGLHELSWDGRDAAGRELASGIYHARLLVQDQRPQICKLTLIR